MKMKKGQYWRQAQWRTIEGGKKPSSEMTSEMTLIRIDVMTSSEDDEPDSRTQGPDSRTDIIDELVDPVLKPRAQAQPSPDRQARPRRMTQTQADRQADNDNEASEWRTQCDWWPSRRVVGQLLTQLLTVNDPDGLCEPIVTQ